MNGEAKAPKFQVRSEDEDWRTHLYNQERMIGQQNELLDEQRRLIGAMEKIADPARLRLVEEGQARMTEAVINLSGKMETANEQLGMAVQKLATTFWGVLKVPVAMVVVGAASWGFFYMEKISERTWLIMIIVSVFPWLSDGIYAVLELLGMRRKGNGNSKPV